MDTALYIENKIVSYFYFMMLYTENKPKPNYIKDELTNHDWISSEYA